MISIIIMGLMACLGASILVYSCQLNYTSSDPLGPMFFPQLLAGLLIILSVVIIVQRIRQGGLREQVKTGVFTIPLFSALYVFMLFQIGFLISTLIFVLLITPFFQHAHQFAWADYKTECLYWLKHPGTYLLIFFLVALVWGVFVKFLYIPLPLLGGE